MQSIIQAFVCDSGLYVIVLYCIVFYLYIYIALLAVHTNRVSSARDPERRELYIYVAPLRDSEALLTLAKKIVFRRFRKRGRGRERS